jgi:hypothetical protein
MYDKLAGLEFEIEDYQLIPLEQKTPRFDRKTTVIKLSGKNKVGVGEDVTYSPEDQELFQKNGSNLDIKGKYTFASFSEKIGGLDLFSKPPDMDVFRNYRRWAFESAAMDLALRQNNTALADFLGLKAQPINFVASASLGEKGDTSPQENILKLYPALHFKLDVTADWTDKVIDRLAKTKAVDTLDFKGHYKGTPVDTKPDLQLYQKVVPAFPDALIEDPHVTDEILEFLKPHAGRVTWDAPLHSVADIKAMPIQPKIVNIKPSRFGPVKQLFSVYEYCHDNGIGMYGGGQFELGVGRDHIQYLAALFHPDGPNDVAPIGFNKVKVKPGLPTPPLTVKAVF